MQQLAAQAGQVKPLVKPSKKDKPANAPKPKARADPSKVPHHTGGAACLMLRVRPPRQLLDAIEEQKLRVREYRKTLRSATSNAAERAAAKRKSDAAEAKLRELRHKCVDAPHLICACTGS